jgi:competence protein ComEC
LGIIHQLKIDPEGYLPVNSGSSTLQGNLAKFRKLIVLNLSKAGFEQEELSIIQALLLGHREDISEETFNNYKNAGAVHILAVSGLHIGILLLLIQFLLAPLRKMAHGKTIILILSVFILWAYAFLAGLSSSVIRAVTMFSFVAYAIYLNRPRNTFNILALSMFFLLLIFDAKLLFDVGFQMSYAAVFSIVWIYPKLQKFWHPQNRILQKFWQLSSVSLAAQLGVFPIALFYFHQFPALFFVSNLIVVPCLGIILGGGILIILLGLINWLPESLSFFYSELIKTMNGFIAWVAKQESFVIQDIPFDGLQLLLVVVLIFTCIYAIMKFNYKRLVYAMTCLACLQLYSIYTIYGVQNKEQVLVMHQTKNTTLFHQSGNELHILTHDTIVVQNLIRNFNVAERIQRTQFANPGNSYVWGSNQLTIIDSMGIYPSTQKKALVLLSQSPKINLERMIDSIKPSQIIADGSNYLSDVNRWRITCLQKKLPFHHTGKEGAYLIKPY